MKKATYLVLAAAGLLMASCSQDDLIPAAGDGTYNITVNLPADLATRATMGEVPAPKQLQYAVFSYEANGTDTTYTNVIADYQNIGTEMSVKLTLNLLAGKQYKLVLFAQAENGADQAYTFDQVSQTITADYSKMTNSAANSSDYYDCFFAVMKLQDSSATYNVNMVRPVAQVNWGTSDLGSSQQLSNAYGANGSALHTVFTIENVPTTLNMLTGEVASTKDITFPTLGVPNIRLYNLSEDAPEPADYPVAPQTYKYIAMQYVLTPSTSTLYDCKLEITGADGVKPKSINLTGVPMQANYRTNIYGALLSNQSDVNIDINPGFGGSNDAPLAWDGSTITIPAITDNQVTINQPSDLAGLAAIVNGELGQTANDLSGVTVTLAADIDLNSHNFPTIGKSTRSSSNVSGNSFRGVFDGNGKTISNLSISSSATNDAVGFIGSLAGSESAVKNITFENININAPQSDQTGVVAIVSEGATVSGITVNSGSIVSNEGSGAIVGRIISEGTVENCINYASVTANNYQAGGIVGAAYYPVEGKTMTVKSCDNYGKILCDSREADWSMQPAGGIVAYSFANVENCNNYGNVSSTRSLTGGIVGWQETQGSITGCTNKGVVSGGCLTGGIVGLVATATEKGITISGNTNEGSVTGLGRVGSQDGGTGGIIGSCGSQIICINNTNSAPSLNGGSDTPAVGRNYVAGIIGQANAAPNQTTGPYVSDNTNNTPLTSMSGNPKDALYNGFTAPYQQ